jgi:hypothetical protein
MTQPEKGSNGRYTCYAYSVTDENEVAAALENLGIKKREVKSDEGVTAFQITKAEANKLKRQGAVFENEIRGPEQAPTGTVEASDPLTAALQSKTTVLPQPDCNSQCVVDSGGVTPWMAPIDIPIPQAPVAPQTDQNRYEEYTGSKVTAETVAAGAVAAVAAVAAALTPAPVKEVNHGERVHHKTSPSTLQAREACTHWTTSDFVSDAAAAGTRQHEAVDKRSLAGLPTDEEATAVTNCIEFANSVEAEFAEKAKAGGGKYVHLNEAYVHVDDQDTSAGYFDEAFIYGDEAALIDYKFGQWEVEPAENNLQGYAYALGLWNKYPKLQKVTVYFVMPYLDTIEAATFTREQAKDMLLRIQTVVARSNAKVGDPTPSFLACYGCGNKAACPALAKIAVKVSEKFAPLKTPKEFDPMKVADPEEAVKGYMLSTLMASWAQAFKGRVTNLAVEDETFLPPGYKVISSADRIITDPKKAFQTLLPVLGEDKLWSMLKFGISNIEKAVKENAPRGEKTAQAAAVVESLEALNLIDRDEEKVYLRAVTGAKDIE